MTRGLLDGLLDRSVVLSFDRNGFARHARRFDPADDERRLDGRVALVTGANSGIGKATARALALRGAEVWMLCRDAERGHRALDELKAEIPDARLRFVQIDLADQAGIRAAVHHIEPPRIDVLVHNAGVLPDHRIETADGLELTAATNLAGPFLLTWLLRDRLVAAQQGRVILVSSGGMYPRKLSVARLVRPPTPFDGVAAYADTKRAMVVLGEQLAERFADTGVVVHTMHPGWAATPAVENSLPRFWAVTRKILRSPEQGADTVVWLATAERPGASSGRFWFDRAEQTTHVTRWTRESPAERQRLWDQLCGWTGIDTARPWHTPAG